MRITEIIERLTRAYALYGDMSTNVTEVRFPVPANTLATEGAFAVGNGCRVCTADAELSSTKLETVRHAAERRESEYASLAVERSLPPAEKALAYRVSQQFEEVKELCPDSKH